MKVIYTFALICAWAVVGWSQSNTLQTQIIDAATGKPAAGVVVKIESTSVVGKTDAEGKISLSEVPTGLIELIITKDNRTEWHRYVDIRNGENVLKPMYATFTPITSNVEAEDVIPTVSLAEDANDPGQNISGILTASRDPFLSAAAFQFSALRFNIRGYNSENTTLYMNGMLMNDIEDGRVFWNEWGGLNDVTRNRETEIGLAATDFAFGGIGGASNIDTRAGSMRKQGRISYALSNRSYNHRIMGTWSSGWTKKGWAFSFSGSRRWAQEGYIPGTFYDAWSYFGSVDKKINDKHTLNLTVLGAPNKRGASTLHVQELYDLTGDNFYNSNWGYQNGKKRNAAVSNSHVPIATLRHDWQISKNATQTTIIGFQTGKSGRTRLDWFEAPDLRTTYYRNLPSIYESQGEEALSRNTEYFTQNGTQLPWHDFYDANQNIRPLANANGSGDTLFGKWSQFIIQDSRQDPTQYSFNTYYTNAINDNLTLQYGVVFNGQDEHNFSVVDDLLGGDFFVNLDRFAIRDSLLNEDARQLDLQNPNKVLKEGDTYGWDYVIHSRRTEGWLQAKYSLPKFDFFLAGQGTYSSMWRTGNYQSGKFPDNSLGDSEKIRNINGAIKGGATYKYNGRNYLYVNAMYQTRAPQFSWVFTSPRTRNNTRNDLATEQIQSIEYGYILRTPKTKARLSSYFTKFTNSTEARQVYSDFYRTFGTYYMTDIEKVHTGIEAGLETKLYGGLSLEGAAAVGQNIYTSRPNVFLVVDNIVGQFAQEQPRTTYLKGYHVGRGPETAASLGLRYNGKKFWFATLSLNYFDNLWIPASPERRTADAVFNLDPESQGYKEIVAQEKTPASYLVNLFVGKSFKIDYDNYIYFNLGINNLLDKTDIIAGGYEDIRFDFEERDGVSFPSRYGYAYGRNYFVSLTWKF